MQHQETNNFRICEKLLSGVSARLSSNSLIPHTEQTLFIDIIYLNVSNNGIKCPQLFRKLMQLCQTWHAHVTPFWFMF